MKVNISSQAQYNAKKMTAEQAAQLVRNDDFIVVPTGAGEPPMLLTALSEIRRSLKNVKVSSVLPMRKFAYIDPETYDNVRHVGYFLSGANRAGAQAGWVDIFPNNFSEVPRKIERGNIGADVVFALCSPMDAHGNFSISLGVDYTMAALQHARDEPVVKLADRPVLLERRQRPAQTVRLLGREACADDGDQEEGDER